MKTLVIGSDHAGYELKEHLIKIFSEKGWQMDDKGTNSLESTDYPEYAHDVASEVEKNGGLGILVCGSGSGVCMTANKHQGIRGVQAWIPQIAQLAREHNDANIVCLPARFITKEFAVEIVDAFVTANFEGGRHERRVNQISCS